MAPNSGEVFLSNLDMSKLPLEAKRKIGYLPEIPPLYLDMYVEEFLRYVALLKHSCSTFLTGLNVYVEDSFQQLSPAHRVGLFLFLLLFM